MLLGVIPPMPGAPAFAAPGLQGPVRGIGGPGFNQMAPLGRGLPPGMRMFIIDRNLISHLISFSFRSTRDVIFQRSAVFLLHSLLFFFVHVVLFSDPGFCKPNKNRKNHSRLTRTHTFAF